MCIALSYILSLATLFLYSGPNGTSAVTELIEFSDTILTLQFRMATSCDNDDTNGGRSLVILELSKDDVIWEQV